MIRSADVIAVVELGKTEPMETKSEYWIYSERTSGNIERCLKGQIDRRIILHGGENFICAQCRFQPGRNLLFLRKDRDLWVGSNWTTGIRPIQNDQVEWFTGEEPWSLKKTPLSQVEEEIKTILLGRKP
jgi:hypothetical protein